MADRGFPLTRHMIIVFSWAIALRIGKDSSFSEYGPRRNGVRHSHPNLERLTIWSVIRLKL